jgi:uncharacterized protein YecT (DUF1311 family)
MMRLLRRLPILLLLVVPLSVSGQRAEIHPIDERLDACTDKDPSTAGMLKCIGDAYKSWDRELNKNYAALLKGLNAEGKQALKTAQLQWISYRDREFRLIESIYSRLQGTMYLPMHSTRNMEIVKQRALDLAEYVNLAAEAVARQESAGGLVARGRQDHPVKNWQPAKQ